MSRQDAGVHAEEGILRLENDGAILEPKVFGASKLTSCVHVCELKVTETRLGVRNGALSERVTTSASDRHVTLITLCYVAHDDDGLWRAV